MVAVAFGLLLLLVGILALRFPDYAFRIIATLVAVILVVAGWYAWTRQVQEARREAVKLTLGIDQAACTSEKPLRLIIDNPDEADITKSWISMHGYRQGFSDPVYEDRLQTDLIVPAGKSAAQCLPLDGYRLERGIDPLTVDLEWEANLTRVNWSR